MAPSFFQIFLTAIFLNIIYCHGTSIKLSPTSVFYSTSKPNDSASTSLSSSSYYTTDSQLKSSPTSYHATNFEKKATWVYSTDNTGENTGLSSSTRAFNTDKTEDIEPSFSAQAYNTDKTGNIQLGSPTSSYFTTSEPNSNFNEKDPSLSVCPRIIVKHGNYIIFSNGTLRIEIFNLTLNSSQYIQAGDSVILCELGFVDEKTELYWSAAHYLLSSLVIQAFTISMSPTYIRIISNKNLGITLLFLFLSNIVFQMSKTLNVQTLHLWAMLPYVLNFVTVIAAAWMTMVAFDFIVLVFKIFDFRIYCNRAMIGRANLALCLLLIALALVTMVTSFFDITSIYLSYPGYLDNAVRYLDKSLPAFSLVLVLTFFNVIGCIFREVAFEKYADDFILDSSKWNVVFLRKYFAAISVWIFIAGAMIYKSWLVFFTSLMLSCIAVAFGYSDRDFTEERLSFFNYIPVTGDSRPAKENPYV